MKCAKQLFLLREIIILSVLISSSGSMFAQIIVEEENSGLVRIWLEAEAGGIDSPMKVFENNDASGGQFIEVVSGNNNTECAPKDGHIVCHFTVNDRGTYKVWGRVIASMDEEDAFWVRMDDNEWVKWKDICVGCNWHWDEVHDNENSNREVTFNLEKGFHTLTFTYLLDQTRLDKILITNDFEFTPTEMGPGATALYSMSSSTPIVDESIMFDGSGSVSSEGAIKSFDWDFGDGVKTSEVSVTHSYQRTGSFRVKLEVTDDQGFTSRISKTIIVYSDDPVAYFSNSPDRPKVGENIAFDASTSFDPNGDIENYLWDFGDGSIGKGKIASHSYESAGEYIASLSVTDSEGNSVKVNRLVTVITGVPKKVIFETDMCLDVDDVGALAVLHALAGNNEAEIIAICFNEAHSYAASAIDAINTWYGRGDIPVGIYKDSLSDPDYSPYLEPVSKFPNDLDSISAPSALEVYQKVLNEQPDSSVTIVSVGFLNNLSDLLRENSNLVARKVKELVIMGGIHNDGFNLSRHNLVSESENVLENWPSPIVISGAGGNMSTGPGLENASLANPVREAYYTFFHGNFCGRPSWDQIAVLYAVRGLSDYFTMNSAGFGSLTNGYQYQMKPGYRTFIETVQPAGYYVRIIQDLMLENSQSSGN